MKLADVKILVAEDDSNTRATIRMMLMEMGITQVFEAGDGKMAQDFVDSDTMDINLVICDWNMPHKTGFEFLREIRTSHPTLPFLMITARADQNSVIEAKEAGVTAYLRKPFTLAELESRVKSALPAISSI